MGAPISPNKPHNLKIFGWDPSLDLTFLFKTYKTSGDVIHPNGPPKLPPKIARR